VPKITCLAGGVGAARFLEGLVKIVPEEDITIIINTGDDIDLLEQHISPDIDIVTYTLAGIVDDERGWGIKGDSFRCLELLSRYGHPTWFNLGDADLATHISRTSLLRQGLKLSEVTKKHAESLNIKSKLIPMTDDPFTTYIETSQGLFHFQEYLVKRGASDQVKSVRFVGKNEAKPATGVLESLRTSDCVIVCPSNPIVSIGTILSIPRIRETLRETCAKVAAISPIIAGFPVKGPALQLMKGLGLEVSAYGVGEIYRDFLDSYIIDNADQCDCERIKTLGLKVTITNTIMKTLKDKMELAKTVLSSVDLAG
jgi:LPPG:FO 2-phospho-L-lactate transferase